MPFATPIEIEETFSEFWNVPPIFSNTAMFGVVDIWEGPVAPGQVGRGINAGTNTVMGVETYKNNVYILQGGANYSWLKVITPDGTKIYDLTAYLCFMTQSIFPPYFSLTVLNEYEVIAGYYYLNLRHQFCSPYGLSVDDMYKNTAFNISNTRTSHGTWVSAVRDYGGWNVYVNSKTSPDNCLPCSVKKSVAKVNFSCVEILFSSHVRELRGYETEQLSYSQGPGYGSKIPLQAMNPTECMKALNDYAAVFNHIKISPDDLGEIGLQVSSNCSTVMYKNMVTVTEYKMRSQVMADEYIERLMSGDNDTTYLLGESKELTGLIGEFLYDISSSLGDNDFTKTLIEDTVWWASLWFTANKSDVQELGEKESAYSLLSGIQLDDFVVLLLSLAAPNGGKTEESLNTMSWILVGKEGTTPIKMGKNNMTYFRFPSAQCISVKKIARIENAFSIDGICSVETRANGILFWAWKYEKHPILKAFLVSNDGVLSSVGEIVCDDAFSPVSGSAMAASDAGGTWIVRDYYLADFNQIEYVETEVEGGNELTALKESQMITNFANVNEVTGIPLETNNNYGDGMLDDEHGRYGLDSGEVNKFYAPGGEGYAYSGYSQLQLESGFRL